MMHGEKKVIPGIEKSLSNQLLIDHGEKVVRNRGCFACHDINGMEKEGRIVNGSGADTDIVIASVKAYVNALNRLNQSQLSVHPQLSSTV